MSWHPGRRAAVQAPGVVGAAMPMGVMAPLSAKMNAAIAPEIIAEKDAVIAELRETNQVGRGLVVPCVVEVAQVGRKTRSTHVQCSRGHKRAIVVC